MWWDIGKIWLTLGSCIVNDLRGMAKVIVMEVVLNDWPFTGLVPIGDFRLGEQEAYVLMFGWLRSMEGCW